MESLLLVSIVLLMQSVLITYFLMLLNKIKKKNKDFEITITENIDRKLNNIYESIISLTKKDLDRYGYDNDSYETNTISSSNFKPNYNTYENNRQIRYNGILNNIFKNYERIPEIIKCPFYDLPYVLMLFRSSSIACCIQNITLNKFQMLSNMKESCMEKSFIKIKNEQYIYYVPDEVYIDLDKTSIYIFSRMFDITNTSGVRRHIYFIEQTDNSEKKKHDLIKLFDYFGIEKEPYLT